MSGQAFAKEAIGLKYISWYFKKHEGLDTN